MVVILTFVLTASGAAALTPLISPFKDVQEDHWAFSDVVWAKNWGFMKGYEDETFRGDNAVSRYELTKVLSNYDGIRHPEVGNMADEIFTLKNEVAQLKLEVAADFPVDHSELAPGATSYLVCKSALDNSRVYTTEFPYAPFEGVRYDANGNSINEKVEVKDCVRTTQEYYDSKVND